MNSRPTIVAAVVVFERFYELLELELLVNLNKQMLGIDEVSETLVGELEQGGVPAVPVEGIKHPDRLLVYDTHAILFPVHIGDNKDVINRPLPPPLTRRPVTPEHSQLITWF